MIDLQEYIKKLSEVSSQTAETDEKEEALDIQDIRKADALVSLDIKREELQGRKQDREQRKGFAEAIFALLCLYLFVVMAIVLCVGNKGITLSDTVLVTLLGTTTANMIGIFNFVAKYLFHTKE